MEVTSIVAIYVLFWVMSAFLMLPFGVRTPDETATPLVRGQAESAPVNFRPGRVVVRATFLSIALCALYIANYFQGWITVEDIDLLGKMNDAQMRNR